MSLRRRISDTFPVSFTGSSIRTLLRISQIGCIGIDLKVDPKATPVRSDVPGPRGYRAYPGFGVICPRTSAILAPQQELVWPSPGLIGDHTNR